MTVLSVSASRLVYPLHIDLLASLVVRFVGAVDPRQHVVGVRLKFLATHVPAVQLLVAGTVLLDVQPVLAVEGEVLLGAISKERQRDVAARMVVEA